MAPFNHNVALSLATRGITYVAWILHEYGYDTGIGVQQFLKNKGTTHRGYGD